MKNRFPKKISKKWLGRFTLAGLLVLTVVKLWSGSCDLLLCGAFVVLVVAYVMLSDFASD